MKVQPVYLEIPLLHTKREQPCCITAMGPRDVIGEDQANFIRVQLLLIEVGQMVLKNVFRVRVCASGNIECWLHGNKSQLQNLKKHKIISNAQWQLLFPKPQDSKWDLCLIVILLQNLCGICPPKRGWNTIPDAHDLSIAADLMRMRQYRNTLQGHSAHVNIDRQSYEEIRMSLSQVFLRLAREVSGTFVHTVQTKISECHTVSLDPHCFNELMTQLQRWEYMDICTILTTLQREFQTMPSIMEQNGQALLKGIEEFLLNLYKNILTREIWSSSEVIKEFILQHVSQLLGKIHVQLSGLEDGLRQSLLTPADMKTSISEILGGYVQMVSYMEQGFEQQHNNAQMIMSKMDQNHMESKAVIQEHTKLLKKLLSCCLHNERISSEHSQPRDQGSTKISIVTQTNAGNTLRSVETQTDIVYNEKVVLSCSHKYYIETLDRHIKSAVSNGETSFRCNVCKEVWNIAEVRELLGWDDFENRRYEEDLNKNFLKKHECDIKCCPGCTLYSERRDTRFNYVVCSNCRLRYCWMCLQKWSSFYSWNRCGNSDCQMSGGVTSERKRKTPSADGMEDDVKAKNTRTYYDSVSNSDKIRSYAIIN